VVDGRSRVLAAAEHRDTDLRSAQALLVVVAMSISATLVAVKVFTELGLLNRPVGEVQRRDPLGRSRIASDASGPARGRARFEM
jgi:hypothetical protein